MLPDRASVAFVIQKHQKGRGMTSWKEKAEQILTNSVGSFFGSLLTDAVSPKGAGALTVAAGVFGASNLPSPVIGALLLLLALVLAIHLWRCHEAMRGKIAEGGSPSHRKFTDFYKNMQAGGTPAKLYKSLRHLP